MATKTAAQEPTVIDNTAYLERLKARTDDPSMRRAITSFATAYLNGGNNIYRLGLELNVKDLTRCQWKHEVNKANGEKYGYKLDSTKRGNNTDEVIYFEKFYAYVVDMSDKLIEFVGVKSDKPGEKPLPMTLGDTVLNPYDRLGVIYNQDGTKGADYDLYNQLFQEYPGRFTSRRFLMIMLADAEGNTLHDIPVMLSLKGGALRYFDEALLNAQSRLGMVESSLIGTQDASPLSIKALRGYLLGFQCAKGDSSNGTMSSPVTAIESIGAEITTDNAHEYFSIEKEELLTGWSLANPDFLAAYDRQVSNAIGTKIRASLEAANDPDQFVLPEATATFSEVA